MSAVPDPMLEAVLKHDDVIRRQLEAMNLKDEAKADALGEESVAIWSIIRTAPPSITTTAGALAAIRFVRDDVDWSDEDHTRLLSDALDFLEGRA